MTDPQPKDRPAEALFIRRSPRDRGKPLSEQDKRAIEEFKAFLHSEPAQFRKLLKSTIRNGQDTTRENGTS
jgi:hypothetical protein